jgi:hypothetical protein
MPDNPEEPFDFILNWTSVQVGSQYINFVIDIYYFSGGAHGISEIMAFNYDIINKKEIPITDFLGNSQQALQKLSELAAGNVITQFESKGVEIDNFMNQMINDGTKPTNENYENFNFKNNSLIIYFQQYQVAPGAYGPVTVTLSKTILEQNSIKSGYLK